MWTLKQFETIFDRYHSSGLSLKDFCQNECILESKFFYWQRKLREYNKRKEQPSDFVPIVFTGPNQPLPVKKTVQQKTFPEHVDPTAGNVLEVVYPNGVKVRVPMGTDPTQLRSLILLIQ